MVGIDAGDISIPMPVPDTATNALNPQFEKCYHNSGTCDEHGQIASINDILINDVPLTSGWIDFTPVGEEPVASSTAVLTIVPTKDNISATTYEIKVAYTTKYGPDITYTAINLSIQCAVTSFTASSNSLPALPYEVFAEAAVFEIATDYFIQDPACGYAYTGVYTWTGTTSYAKVPTSITDGSEIRVTSINPAHADAGDLDLSFTSVLTIADNNGVSEDFTISTPVTMTVTITDPCDITQLDPLALSATTISVIDGESDYIEWDIPTVEADTRLDGTDLCDAVEFEVFEDTADTPVQTAGWATVTTETSGKIRLTVDTANVDLIDAEASVDYTLQIRSRLTNYPDRKHYTEVAVTINAATCDCQYLLWSDASRVAATGETPSSVAETINVGTPGTVTLATPTPDALTGLTHAAFQKCFAGGADECPRSGRYAAASDLLLDGAPLPAWITMTPVGSD